MEVQETTDGVADKEGKTSFYEEEIAQLREYFSKMTCRVRVLGCQLGLEPHELDEIEEDTSNLADHKRLLLDTCIRKRLLKSWEELVAVLEKPALRQHRWATEIRKKHIYSRQFSLDSHSSMNSPSSPEQSLALTIPEAVNIIMAVDDDQLQELGQNLRLHPMRIRKIAQYHHEEHHQRLIEQWFEQEYEPQREKLVEALPRRLSIDSASINPSYTQPTPTSASPREVELQIRDFEVRFSELQADTEQNLVSRNKTVETVSAKLRGLPPRIRQDHEKFVKKLSRKKGQPSSLQELFNDLNKYCWNCFEYELLEFVIRVNRCGKPLENRMDVYTRDVKTFKENTTISLFIQYGKQFFKKKSSPKHYNKSTLRTIQDIDPDKEKLSYLDRFREDVCMKLSDCLMQIDSINDGSVETEWIVPEEFDHDLISFFCSEEGKELLKRHQVNAIYLNDMPIDDSLLLLSSAVHGEWETVDSLLEEDIDLNKAKEESGKTALFFVASSGKDDLVGKMLERGADPDVQDNEGQTALMVAVKERNKRTVEAFLQEKCDLNIQEKNNLWSVLHISADMGLADVVELLVQPTYEIELNLKDKVGRTAQEIAEEKGHTQIAEILKSVKEHSASEEDTSISHPVEGAPGRSGDLEGDAPKSEGDRPTRRGVFQRMKEWFQKDIRLNRAAVRGSLIDVQKALQNKTNPNGITNKLTLRTPLMEASERGHTEVVKLLLSNGADPTMIAADNRTALMLAAKGGYVDTVEVILQAKLPPEILNAAAGFWKWTALHTVAFYRGYNKKFTKDEYHEKMKRITGILLEAGADPFARDKTGDTALSLASYKGYEDIVKVIIEKTDPKRRKELIDHQRNDQWSALLLAARHGRQKVVQILLENKASMTVSNKAMMTALHLGVRSADEDTVKTLASKADPSAINAIDSHGYTPLIIATKLKNLKLVEVLVDAGADVNIQGTKEKRTALMYAAKLNSVSLVTRFVEEYKADLSLKDANQQSARTYASDKKVQKLIDKLLKEKEQREKVQGDSKDITSLETVTAV